MAVNMNKRAQWKIVVFVFLAVCAKFASASTTAPVPATNTTPATVDVNTTTTAAPTTTTTVPTTTTTTIAPLQPPTQLDSNSLIGQCPCDLTGNACDVNCCCDEDCTGDDRQAFSFCLAYSYNVDDRLCFRKEIILFENSQPVFSNITDDDLFCIYYDNNEERNFYTNPDLIQTLTSFQDYRSQFFSFSFQSDFVSQFDFTAQFYKSGDPIYTVFESLAIGVLGLPRTLTATDCVDENPTAYLLDESFTCSRRVQSLSAECTSTPGLDADKFFSGFKVITSPQLFQDFNSTLEGNVVDGFFNLFNNTYTISVALDETVGVQPIQCIDDVTGLIGPCAENFTTPPSPRFENDICRNVVRQVHYRLITDGTNGITRVLARFVLSNISADGGFQQTFSSAFETASSADSFKRSGNPGYVVGQPVLAGTLNITTDSEGTTDRIILNGNRDAYMTVVKPTATGDCINQGSNRMPVTFGNSIRTGCFLRVSASNISDYCALLQQAVVNVTEYDSVPVLNTGGTAYLPTDRYVGLYGNSDVSKTGDWVRILYERPTPTPPVSGSSSCPVSLGMHIQILYANIGALVNPQPKIIGVSFLYDPPQTVQIRCAGGACQPNNFASTQGIEISTSVAFIDVSTPATAEQGEPPIFLAKVPYDFFYPFITGGVKNTSPALPIIVVLVLLALASQSTSAWF